MNAQTARAIAQNEQRDVISMLVIERGILEQAQAGNFEFTFEHNPEIPSYIKARLLDGGYGVQTLVLAPPSTHKFKTTVSWK